MRLLRHPNESLGLVRSGFELAILKLQRCDYLPPQYHGSTRVEVIWTAIPALIVVILFGFSIQTLAAVETRTPDPLTVEVEAFPG